MNLATLAQRQAERYGDRLLALVDDEPVTYADLAEKSARFAAGLQALGIEPGDRVALMMPTRPEFLYAWFGILAAGAIEVPIHDAARGPGIAYILDTTGARAFVVDEEHVDHVADQIGGVESLQHVIVTGPSRTSTSPSRSSRGLLEHDPAEVVERKASDIASILFTGGTTGPPKGVALPHNHNLNLAQGVCDMIGYTEDDAIYSVFPLFHANAKYMTVLAAMLSGAKCVIHKRFSASRFWGICLEHGITAFNGQGEMLRILLKQPESESDRTNSVRVVVGAAAADGPRPGVRAALRPRRPRRLRHDGDRADDHGPVGPAPAGRRRAADAVVRGPARRRERRRRPGRGDGRDRRPAAQAVRDDGALLGQRRGDARVDAQPVVPHGRQRLPGRGRLLLVRRPRHGLDPPPRRERLRLGGRARARRP